MSQQRQEVLDQAIAQTAEGEYLPALNLFLEVFGEGVPAGTRGASEFALCLALVNREYDRAIGLAEAALENDPERGSNFWNLAKIYIAAGERKRAVEIVDRGLELQPENERLLEIRNDLGKRARPPLPFLGRNNALNQAIGRRRYMKRQQREILDDE
jgi:tetratricopeptide (TPR) repeat protein